MKRLLVNRSALDRKSPPRGVIETVYFHRQIGRRVVAPRTGAWIETILPGGSLVVQRRPPHGGVD